jgi:hypothetical protein
MVCDELRIRQILRYQQLTHRIPEVVGVLAVIEPELQFVEVSVEVLRGYLMVATHDGAFQEAPHVLYGVLVNVSGDVFLVAELDSLVLGVLIRDAPVGRPLVGVIGFGVASGVLADEAVQGFPIRAPNNLKADVPATLHGTDHDDLVSLVAAPLAFQLATDNCFVNLDDGPCTKTLLLAALFVALHKKSVFRGTFCAAARRCPSRIARQPI